MLGASQGQQPCRKGLTGVWGVFQSWEKLWTGYQDRTYLFVGGCREESCSPLMGLGFRVYRGFLWCQGEHLLHPSIPCSLRASSPAARAQTPSSGLWFWEEADPDSQWDLGVGVCQGQALWGHLYTVGLQS